MGRTVQRFLLFALLFGLARPALAVDPIVMFLLSMAREAIVKGAMREQAAIAARPPAPAERYPGTVVEPAELKRLIDESFTYLSQAQRQEIFDSLHAALMDPKNAAVRASMIAYFAERAVAVREAQDRLAHLTPEEKQRLVADFKKELAAMPDEEAAQITELLRKNLLPLPTDLNDMLLAAAGER